MRFGFICCHGITNTIFIVKKLQEKYLEKKKNLDFACIHLEKAFDKVPLDVVWWTLKHRKVLI